MKKLRAVTAALLSICLIFSCAFTGGISAKAQSDEIYYSDIYYAYSSYICESPVFTNYTTRTQEVFDNLYEDYLNSSEFKWTLVKEGLKEAVDLKSFIQTVSDAYADTNFTYNGALDSANEIFAQHLLSTDTSAYQEMDAASEWNEKLSGLIKLFETYEEYEAGGDLSDEELIKKAVELIANSEILGSLSSASVLALENGVISELSSMLGFASIGGDVLKAGKALMLAVMIEDMRLSAVDDILSVADEGALYDGMTRLQSQLRNGFVSYFIDSYITKAVLDKLADAAIDKLVSSLLGSSTAKYNLISAVSSVSTWVVFDVIFDVTDLDELTTQLVIKQYAKECTAYIKEQANAFTSQFTHNDIEVFQTFFAALKAATDASLTASEKIALDSNISSLREVKTYLNYDIYAITVNNVKETLESTPANERRRTYYTNWYVSSNAALCPASNDLESGYIYCTDGYFNGNLTLSSTSSYNGYSLTAPEDCELTVAGNLTVGYQNNLYINGILRVTGDLSVKYSGSSDRYYGYINMSSDTAKLYVGGNFTADSVTCCNITGGEIILNGTSAQTVTNLKAYDITVTNPEGLIYGSSVYLYGHYDLGGNPIDLSNYYTLICDKDASFDPASNFGTVYLHGNSYNLSGIINADFTVASDTYYNVASITVAEGSEAFINGNFYLGYNNQLNINGTLRISGNLTAKYTSSDRYYGYINMSSDTARLYVGGNFTADSVTCCNITGGEIILNGTSAQTVTNLKAYDITVTNPEGLIYGSSVYLYGHYDLGGNPIDLSNYYTLICDKDASFDPASNFGTVYLHGNSYNLSGIINADFTVASDTYYNVASITVAEGSEAFINGNFYLGYNNQLNINGTLRISGNLTAKYTSSDRYYGYINMSSDTARLYVGGNFAADSVTCCNITGGSVIFDGNTLQTVKYLKAPAIILLNESESGVVFSTAISPGVLFDHNGLAYTLYNSGSGSSFADYDGDGMKDNVDDDPTVFNNEYYYGILCDMNGDGVTNIKDLVSLKKQLAAGSASADFNGDGSTDTAELTFIKKVILKLYAHLEA